MALDKVMIGARIRKIREEIFNESRDKFGNRCNLTEGHIGQIERGEFLIGLNSLDEIISATGADADYILYGKSENDNFGVRKNLMNIINRTNNEELNVIYNCITTVRNYLHKKNKF